MDRSFLDIINKKSKPKRKVIKKHIAEIIEKMLEDKNNNLEQNIKETAKERAKEIDQVCYIQYGDDGIAYNKCVTKELEATSEKICSKEITPTETLFLQMKNSLGELKEYYNNPDFDNIKNGLQKTDISWLINFIEMVDKRSNIKGLEQNISIAYFSSYLPITKKIISNKLLKKETDDYAHFLNNSNFVDNYYPIEETDWMFE